MPGSVRRILITGIVFAIALGWCARAMGAGTGSGPFLPAEKLLWRGDYRGALGEIVRAAAEVDDPALLEYGLFVMAETLRYPEMIDDGIAACESLRTGNAAFARHEILGARLRMLHSWLSLRAGDTSTAEKALRELGFIREFRLIGPFSVEGAEDFDAERLGAESHGVPSMHAGKLYPVRWFSARTDRLGILDPGERNLDTADVRYYLEAEFTVERAGARVFHIGKTGHARIWMDGKPLFKSETRHRFAHDQYRVTVRCGPGRHRLLIQLEDSLHDGVRFSLRHTAAAAGDDAGSARWFDALGVMRSRASAGGRDDAFRAGFLVYAAGLNTEDAGEAAALFQKAMGSVQYGRMARYYLALCRDDEEKRSILLREAAAGDGAALLPTVKIVQSRMQNGFIHEAPPLIETIRSMNPSCPAALELEASYFIGRGWYDEALKRAASLEDSGFPSAGASVRARVMILREQHRGAAYEYARLWRMDRFNRDTANALAEAMERSGQPVAAAVVLEEAAHIFDCDVSLRRRLAGVVRTARGTEAALPYLTAALAIAPDDSGVLFDLGSLYHRQGATRAGLRYMKEALLRNPDNFRMKEYIDAIERVPDALARYRAAVTDALIARADAYRDEAAVMILDECVMKIMADGSYEKTVRKVFRINAESAIRDFSTQYILFNPSTDRVEDVRCVVNRGGETVETSETYARSLSDPESRMYYDVQARVLAVPALGRGSLVDLSYRLRSGEARLYRGYIGERIMAGGRYRTLVSNIVISRPEGMPLHVRLSGLNEDRVSVMREGGRRIYRLSLENRSPIRDEVAMPHHSEIIPSLIVSSHGSWDEAARWYASLMRGRTAMSAEMRRDLSGVIAGADSDIAKMRNVYNHVNASIRYVGFELGLGGLQPRSADLTYATRMGDCKDLTLVLVSMLRASGIDARMALVRTRERGALDRSIPSIGQFNHAICFVNLEGGVFLDATAKMAGFRELPSEDRNIQALVIDERGHSFINTAGRFYHANLDSVVTEVGIESQGGAELNRKLTKGGAFARSARGELLDKSEKLRGIGAYWNSKYSGASVSTLIAHRTGTEMPVEYSYNVRIPSFLSPAGGYAAFPAFIVSSDYYREYGMMKSRVSPVRISSGWTSDTVVRFTIPRGWDIAVLPAAENRAHPGFSARFEYVRKGDSVFEARSSVVFVDSSISPEEYGVFRDFLIFIHRKENERIIIRKIEGPGGGDAR